MVKIGFFGASVGGMASPRSGEVASVAEDLGYASLWVAEHMVVPRPKPDYFIREPEWSFGDPLVMLAYLAAHTNRIELCTGVLILPQRNPVHLAKELATLDVLCGGRLVAGVGVGHLEREMEVLGVVRENRQVRAMESIEVMRSLWSTEPPEHHGDFYALTGVDAYPKPVQVGGPRIVMGGNSEAAFRRAAKYAVGWYGFGHDPMAAAEAVEQLKRQAESMGRDLNGFEISVTPPVRLDADLLTAYEKAGVDQIVVSAESETIDGVVRRLQHNRPANFGLAGS